MKNCSCGRARYKAHPKARFAQCSGCNKVRRRDCFCPETNQHREDRILTGYAIGMDFGRTPASMVIATSDVGTGTYRVVRRK